MALIKLLIGLNLLNFINNFKLDFLFKLIIPFMFINFGNFINYLINIIQAKNLSVEHFGLLNSYLTFLFFLSIPTMVLPQLFIKIYKSENHQINCINFFVLLFLLIILFITIILLLFKNSFINSFNFYEIKFFIIYSLLISFFTNLNIILNSIILSQKNYNTNAIFTGLFFYVKLPLILILILISKFNVNNLIFIHLGSFIISFIFIFLYLRKINLISINRLIEILKSLKFYFPVKYFNSIFSILVCQLLIFFTVNFDILICRKFCSEFQSSLYNGATIISKIIFFLPSAIAIILMVEHNKSSKNSYFNLFKLLIFSSVLLIIYNFIFIYFSDFIIELILTKAYLEVTNQIITMNIAMSLLVLSNYCYQILLIQKNYYFAKQLIFMIIFSLITYYFNSGSSLKISQIFLIFSTVNLIITFYDIYKYYKKI